MEGLTRQEKEEYILELYRQKKTYHEIAKEARISLRDIGPILKKSGIEQSLSLSSQAYKLFSERKSPNEVAIALNIREPEVTQLYREYWRLSQIYELNQIYEETKGNFSYLLELYRQMKTAGMTVAHIISLLRIANGDLPSVEYRYQELQHKEASLRADNSNAVRTFQELSDRISDEYKTLSQYRLFSDQKKQEIDKIQSTKLRLEELVEYFQNNNEEYLNIKETIKREVSSTIKDARQLLRIALISLIVSSRKDPSKFQALYYNMNIPATVFLAHTVSRLGDNVQLNGLPKLKEQNIPFNSDDIEADYEKTLLTESEMLYNKIVDDTISRIVYGEIDSEMPNRRSKEASQNFSTYLYGRGEEQALIQSELESEEDHP
jgi:hypothetical protein